MSMYKIKHTWTYKHIQLVIILGLVTGIAIESTGVAASLASVVPENTTMYIAEAAQEHKEDCDQKCALNKWAHERAIELYAENKESDLEKYRMEAITEGKDMLINILDESEFYDYGAMREKYGY